jgi:hypothetical protein
VTKFIIQTYSSLFQASLNRMKFSYIIKNILLFFTLLVIIGPLNAQTVAENNTTEKQVLPNSSGGQQTEIFELRHLQREGKGYLQLVENNTVFLQIAEDDVVSMKRLRQENIRIRRFSTNNQKNLQFVKGKEVLKSIVEDHVVFSTRIVEDHVVFFTRIVEDHVVFLTRIVEDHVVFLDMVKNSTAGSNSIQPFNAQQINTDSLKKIAHDSLKQARRDSLKRSNAIRHLALGISAGFPNAPGLDLAYKFRSHWTARLGYGYLDYGVKNQTFSISSTDDAGITTSTSFLFSVAAHISNINGLLEYGLGQKGRFRLIAGAAYFPQKKITASVEMLSELKLSAVPLRSSDVGSGDIEIGYANKVSPYFGFGIGRVIPRRRINLGLDFGAYYMGDYRVKINVNPGFILKENEENAPIIERNLNAHSFYKILPSGNLRLSYRLF